ncbi:MAG: thioredoxin [Methermicoccaceae archaeon]
MEDSEIEKIKREKLETLMKKAGAPSAEAPDKPIILTDATIQKVIDESQILVVDCWAEWCAPCRMIAPVIENLAKQYAGRVTFGKVDADQNPQIMGAYGIGSIPTLLFFKDGKFIGKKIGALPQPMLTEIIEPLLQG